ncbi:MAG: hypothetical protein Ct9H300mP19_11600 [Dehalococcoidia bacterium]|nr:MAG: hypothetical protein Ct9H300mP19_11600 [Dehalococcoidia bacterium]
MLEFFRVFVSVGRSNILPVMMFGHLRNSGLLSVQFARRSWDSKTGDRFKVKRDFFCLLFEIGSTARRLFILAMQY